LLILLGFGIWLHVLYLLGRHLYGLLHRGNLNNVVPVPAIVTAFRLVFRTKPLVVDDELVLMASRSRNGHQQLKLAVTYPLHGYLFPIGKRARNICVISTVPPSEKMLRHDGLEVLRNHVLLDHLNGLDSIWSELLTRLTRLGSC
jgi:hypothetical protein